MLSMCFGERGSRAFKKRVAQQHWAKILGAAAVQPVLSGSRVPILENLVGHDAFVLVETLRQLEALGPAACRRPGWRRHGGPQRGGDVAPAGCLAERRRARAPLRAQTRLEPGDSIPR